MGSPAGLEVKNLPAMQTPALDSISGLGRVPAEGNGYLLQNSCLGNLMDREAWWAADQIREGQKKRKKMYIGNIL